MNLQHHRPILQIGRKEDRICRDWIWKLCSSEYGKGKPRLNAWNEKRVSVDVGKEKLDSVNMGYEKPDSVDVGCKNPYSVDVEWKKLARLKFVSWCSHEERSTTWGSYQEKLGSEMKYLGLKGL